MSNPMTRSESETAPLLEPQAETAVEVPETARSGDSSGGDATSLPMGQVVLLCLARMCEALSFFVILPFVNQMIADTGSLPASDVGFYSGLIESLFSLTQMVLMVPYGTLSDSRGRKPILVSSLLMLGLSTTLFGLSRSVGTMVACRMLAGASAGTVVTVRTMLSEVSGSGKGSEKEARAFGWFGVFGNAGMLVGPILGGLLAEPGKTMPGLFGGSRFLRLYPYFLPGAMAGILCFAAALFNLFFLKETLVRTAHSESKTVAPRTSIRSLLLQRDVLPCLLTYTYTMLLGTAYTAVTPLFWYTPVTLSGLGFSPPLITLFLSLSGVAQAVFLIALFPRLQVSLGTRRIMRICAVAWVFNMSSGILLNVLLRSGATIVFWIIAPLNYLLLASFCCLTFTSAQLLLNSASPSSAVLGTLNSIALALNSGVRAGGPAVFTSIFAIGVRNTVLGGYLGLVVLTALAMGYMVLVSCGTFGEERGKISDQEPGETWSEEG